MCARKVLFDAFKIVSYFGRAKIGGGTPKLLRNY